MTAAYFEDTDRLGLGRPDHEPLASETIDAIVELIQALIDSGHAYAAGGDVYFRVASFDGYGKLSQPAARGDAAGRGRRRGRAEGEPAGLRALEGRTRRARTPPGPRRGARAGPAGTSSAPRWPSSILGVDFDVHGGGSDLVFPHHENEIAQTEAARGKPLARIWMHNGMVQHRRREDGQVGGQHLPAARGARRVRAGGADDVLRERPLPPAARLLAGGARGRPRRRWRRCATSCGASTPTARSPRARPPTPSASSTRWPTTSTPRPPAACCSSGCARPTGGSTRASGCGPGRLAEMLHLLGLEALLEAERRGAGRGGRAAAGGARGRPARRGDFELADRKRDELAELGFEVRDTAEGPRLVRARLIVYGRNPVREALRGRRQVEPRSGRRPSSTGCEVGSRSSGRGRRPRGAVRLARPPGRVRRGRAVPLRRRRTRCSRPRTRSSSASTRSRTRTTSARSAAWPRPRARRAS